MKNALYASKQDDNEPEVMDDSQAAVFLGISTKSLRKLRQNNQVPFAQVGGLIRYLRSELVQWLKAGGTNQINQTNSKGNA